MSEIVVKTVKKFEFPVSHAATSKYDWDLLLDGNIHQITGVEADPQNFKMMARSAAQKRHMTVKIHVSKDEVPVFTVQAERVSDEHAAEIDVKLQERKEREKARRIAKQAKKQEVNATVVGPVA